VTFTQQIPQQIAIIRRLHILGSYSLNSKKEKQYKNICLRHLKPPIISKGELTSSSISQ